MKKKNLKSLKLSKKIISNFKQEEIKGGTAAVCLLTACLLSASCKPVLESDACTNTQGDYSCQCTIA